MKVYSSPGSVSAVWPAGTLVYPGPTGAYTGQTAATRRYLIVGQDLPIATRYLVDGAEDGVSAAMAWLPAASMANTRDEAFNAGVTAAAQRAEGAQRA